MQFFRFDFGNSSLNDQMKNDLSGVEKLYNCGKQVEAIDRFRVLIDKSADNALLPFYEQLKDAFFPNHFRQLMICHFGAAYTSPIRDYVIELDKRGVKQIVISYAEQNNSIIPKYVPVFFVAYLPHNKDFNQINIIKDITAIRIDQIFKSLKKLPDFVYGHDLKRSCIPLLVCQEKYDIPTAVFPWNVLSITQPEEAVSFFERKCFSEVTYYMHSLPELYRNFCSFYESYPRFFDTAYILDFSIVENNHHTSAGGPRILSARQCGVEYKQMELLQAMPGIIKKYPDVKLRVLIGFDIGQSQKYFEYLKEIANNLGITNHVEFDSNSYNLIEFGKLINDYNIVFCVASQDTGASGTACYSVYSGAITIIQKSNWVKGFFDNGQNVLYTDLDSDSIQQTVLYAIENLDCLLEKFTVNRSVLVKYDKKNVVDKFIDLVVKTKVKTNNVISYNVCQEKFMQDITELNKSGVESFYAGDFSEARKCFLEVIRERPDNFDANYNLAALCYTEGDKLQSAKHYIEAYKIKPFDEELVLNFSALLCEIKQADEAKIVFKSFLDQGKYSDSCLKAYEELFNENYHVKLRNPLPGKLKILFVQSNPCIRNFKYAEALSGKGHSVILAYSGMSIFDRYKKLDQNVYTEVVKIKSNQHLWELSKDVDIVHCHNEPDELTVAALAGGKPVIHDTHDMSSLRDNADPKLTYFESIANRASHGQIYTTPYQRDFACKAYGVNSETTTVFYNYASKSHLPRKFLPKLSAKDGKTHIVFEGGINQLETYRNFNDLFLTLIKDPQICLHVYPSEHTIHNNKLKEIFKGYDNLFYYDPIAPDVLLEVLTQYDCGLIPWNLNYGHYKFLSSTIANKLFEYMAAGLPVAATAIESYKDYFAQNPVGVTFLTADELIGKIPDLKRIAISTDYSAQIFTYENQIDSIESFYSKIIDRYKSNTTRLDNDVKKLDNTAIYYSFDKLYSYLKNNGWKGYDPYDIQEYAAVLKRQGDESKAKEVLANYDKNPLDTLINLGVNPRLIPKGLGLLCSANAILYSVTNKKEYLDEAVKLADWLIENPSSGYKNLCWGYPFDWQSIIWIPKDTPSIVVSATVGDGLWELYKITLNKKYLNACISICHFITEDIKRDRDLSTGFCFSYTPIDNYLVHNANLLGAEFLARVAVEIENEEWLKLAQQAASYTISEQNPDGSIFYWGIKQKQNGLYADNYHIGFEIRSLHKLYLHTGIDLYKTAYSKCLDFYLSKLITTDNKPMHFPAKSTNNQTNIHDCSESILVLSLLALDNPNLMHKASAVFKWTIDNMQHNDGWFIYNIINNTRNEIPFLRWGQAWMLRAFAEYFRTSARLSKKIGFYEKNSIDAGWKADCNDDLWQERRLLLNYRNFNGGSIPSDLVKKLLDRLKLKATEIDLIFDASKFRKRFYETNQEKLGNVHNEEMYHNFQLVMPDQKGLPYGSYEWNENQFAQSETDPWGHDWRASQQIRYIKSIDMLKASVDPLGVNSILDIGCCLADFTQKLHGLYEHAQVSGVDISKTAVNKCKIKYPDMKFLQSSLPEMKGLEDSSYDLISAMEVLCYVDNSQKMAAFENIISHINNNGYLLISSYMNKEPFMKPADFINFIGSRLEILDIEIRHHLFYYDVETPLKNFMDSIGKIKMNYNIKNHRSLDKFMKSSFNLLGDLDFMEEMDKLGCEVKSEKSVSHTVILARKKS